MQTFGSRTKVEGVMMGERLSYQQHALHANALGVTRSSGPDLGICTLAAWHRDLVLIGEAILCPHPSHPHPRSALQILQDAFLNLESSCKPLWGPAAPPATQRLGTAACDWHLVGC